MIDNANAAAKQLGAPAERVAGQMEKTLTASVATQEETVKQGIANLVKARNAAGAAIQKAGAGGNPEDKPLTIAPPEKIADEIKKGAAERAGKNDYAAADFGTAAAYSAIVKGTNNSLEARMDKSTFTTSVNTTELVRLARRNKRFNVQF